MSSRSTMSKLAMTLVIGGTPVGAHAQSPAGYPAAVFAQDIGPLSEADLTGSDATQPERTEELVEEYGAISPTPVNVKPLPAFQPSVSPQEAQKKREAASAKAGQAYKS